MPDERSKSCLAVRSPGADPYKDVAAAATQASCAAALAALAPFGFDPERRRQFAAAHQQAFCHQCRTGYCCSLKECPCPHWLVGPARRAAQVVPVLNMYSLGGILHFLLLYVLVTEQEKPRSYERLATLCDGAARGIRFRIGFRQWTFLVQAGDDGRYRLAVELFNLRSRKYSTREAASFARDAAVADAVVQALRASME